MFHHAFMLGPGFDAVKRLVKYRTCMQMDKPKGLNERKQHYIRRRNTNSMRKFPACKHLIQTACSGRDIRAFKTIRMTMEQISSVLAIDPEVKVIYSTRDPLGMVSSRYKIDVNHSKKFNTPLPPFKQRIVELCVRVRRDRKLLVTLQKSYPNNLYVTSYETMYADVQGTAEEVYQFLGLDMPASVNTWVMDQVNRDGHVNQTEKWRTFLTEEQVKIVHQQCDDLIVKS